jgi:two-component system, NarL family, sensor histidine kinase BarA
MPVRGSKHLLGETSLERKCLFVFGLVILVIVSASFFWYGQKAENLVRKQTTQMARMLVRPTLMNIHYSAIGNANFEQALEMVRDDLKPLDDLPNHEARALALHKPNDAKTQPRDEFERATLARFIQSAATRKPGHSPEKSHTFADGSPSWAEHITRNNNEYHYIQAVFFKAGCLMDCHGNNGHPGNHLNTPTADGRHWAPTQPGDLAGAVVVSLPAERMARDINGNRATMITFALTTAVLAMVSSYLAIRFVVVRPVERLRDITDASDAEPCR